MTRCQATTRVGRRCKNNTASGSSHCIVHVSETELNLHPLTDDYRSFHSWSDFQKGSKPNYTEFTNNLRVLVTDHFQSGKTTGETDEEVYRRIITKVCKYASKGRLELTLYHQPSHNVLEKLADTGLGVKVDGWGRSFYGKDGGENVTIISWNLDC